MAVDASALFIPGFATVFQATVGTAMPSGGLTDFTLQATGPTGWENLGHTSKANMVNFSKDGGDKTSLDTALAAGVRTVYDSESWSLGVNALQLDKTSLDLAFNGDFDDDDGYIVPASNNGVSKALFVLCQDGTAQLGFYIPNTSVKLGDAPDITDPTQFAELPLAAAIQAAAEAVIPSVNGVPGIMKIYRTGLAAPGA